MTYEEHAKYFELYRQLEKQGNHTNARVALKNALNITLEEVDAALNGILRLPSIEYTLNNPGVAEAYMGNAMDYLRTYRDTQIIKHTRKQIHTTQSTDVHPTTDTMFMYALTNSTTN